MEEYSAMLRSLFNLRLDYIPMRKSLFYEFFFYLNVTNEMFKNSVISFIVGVNVLETGVSTR